jgi:6-phosphofructokinase 1
MNAAIRAAVFAAAARGMRIYGIQCGYQGLYDADWEELTPEKVDDIHQRGGTVLRTARFLPFSDAARRKGAIRQCIRNCRKNRDAAGNPNPIEGLVVVGGDGSFRGAFDLTKKNLPCVCLPGTIDNDIACTDETIGYDTCLNAVCAMVDAIADTARSHDRCIIVEVMGNMAGDLTLYAGMAAGAVTVVPEEGYDLPEQGEMSAEEVARFDGGIAQAIAAAKAAGRRSFVVLVAEGFTGKKDKNGRTRYPGGMEALAKRIQQLTGVETRADVLGYVQRGGKPSARDRILAAQMGARAVRLLAENQSNRVVILRGGAVSDLGITRALHMPKKLSAEDIALAKSLRYDSV